MVLNKGLSESHVLNFGGSDQLDGGGFKLQHDFVIFLLHCILSITI
jgi:hypothetical protein